MKDNLISKGNINQVIEVDNKVSLTSLDEVRLTTSKKLEVESKEITKKVPIDIDIKAKIGSKLKIVFTKDNHSVTYEEDIVKKAINNPLSKEKIINQLKRLGNTPFISKKITYDIDDNIFIRIGDLNIARRTLTERLIGSLINDYKEPIIKDISFKKIKENNKIDLKDYQIVERNPFYLKDILKEKSIVNNLFKPETKVIAGYHLNITNSYTAYYLYKLGYQAVYLSVELNELELKDLVKSIKEKFGFIPIIIKSKGYVEVMLIKGNILNIDKDIIYTLVNLKNDKFQVFYDGKFTHINSCYEINLKEELKEDNLYYSE